MITLYVFDSNILSTPPGSARCRKYYKVQATLISVTSPVTKAIRNLPDKMSTTILTTTIIKHKTFTLTNLFMSVGSEKEKAVWTIRHIVLVT